MSEQAAGGLILALTLSITGFVLVLIGRAGERRSLDWAWAQHTSENTAPEVWDSAHRVAGPIMRRSGWLFVGAGVVGGPLLAWNEVVGLFALGMLVASAIGVMALSIHRGLRVLRTADS